MKLVDTFIYFGMPAVLAYHLLTESAFLNTSASDASGIEKVADQVLLPVQYVINGKIAIEKDGRYRLQQRFDYTERFPLKMTASCLSLPVSMPLGCLLKGIAFLFPDTRERHAKVVVSQKSKEVHSNLAHYKSLGLAITPALETLEPQGFKREPGAEKLLPLEKELLREIAKIFKENEIPFWVDCGTLIGTYRYGGVVPWDDDVDVAILLDDFENAWHALRALDESKYHVQDWSNRLRPNTYIRVYIKENHNYIDIYHFQIDPEKRMLTYLLSNEISSFMTENWKARERRYTVPTSFDIIFPLKKASFDGIEVFVPNDTAAYLKQRYGENLAPVKLYNEATGKYEKDLNHPYWQLVNAK